MNLSDLPSLEVALRQRDILLALQVKYREITSFVLVGQESMEPEFVAKVRVACVDELTRMIAGLTERIAELGVTED